MVFSAEKLSCCQLKLSSQPASHSSMICLEREIGEWPKSVGCAVYADCEGEQAN